MTIIETLKDLSKDICLKSGNKIMQWNWCTEAHCERWFVYGGKEGRVLLTTDNEEEALKELLKQDK